ncbi:MAG: hypothetical protein LBV51_00810 [Acholeplasmatales bacterium]|nr:hypothetical protein [Acholeplasmatales bacterium]
MQTQTLTFAQQIDIVIKEFKTVGNFDKYKWMRLVILDSLPQVLQNIGFRGDNLTLSVKKFFDILDKHSDELNEEILKQLPDKIANPLAIIKSKSLPNSIVMIIDLDNENGNKLIVPISLQDRHPEIDILGATRLSSIDISSVYGNDDDDNPRANELLEYAINSKEVIYIDNDLDVYDVLKELAPDIVYYKQADLYDFKNNEVKAFYPQPIQNKT